MHTGSPQSQLIPPGQWKQRLEALGLTLLQAAKEAGVHHTGLYRQLKAGGEGNFTRATMEAMSRVITAHEARLRQHLDQVAGRD